jgi:hypothetical protein
MYTRQITREIKHQKDQADYLNIFALKKQIEQFANIRRELTKRGK